jgi:hypothetical protein
VEKPQHRIHPRTPISRPGFDEMVATTMAEITEKPEAA